MLPPLWKALREDAFRVLEPVGGQIGQSLNLVVVTEGNKVGLRLARQLL